MKTSGTIEKHRCYQRKPGNPTTKVSQASDQPQPANSGNKIKQGRCLIDHQPLSHGIPKGQGQPVSHGQTMDQGQPMSYGQPMSHGRPMSHGHTMGQGQPISYGQPISHCQPMTQGQSVGHGQPVGHLQPTSVTQLTSRDLTTDGATSTDGDQPGHEICDLKMLPLPGAELRICIDEALSATEDAYTSSFYYTHRLACKVQLHVRFLKDGHLAVHVAVVKGELDGLHKWPVEFSGNGYIFNTSTGFSELWTIRSKKLDKPETEAILEAEVCLKTASNTISNIEYTKLKDMRYQYNGYFRFLWDLKAKEPI
ncbi:unnamed protein product [Lymnaea stagnalis]|uniref:MATH domain-containing protein n=1 Tax=Lymnaea stagnalis TaxID=6523 RepID=A0AAV2HFS1_LYMST